MQYEYKQTNDIINLIFDTVSIFTQALDVILKRIKTVLIIISQISDLVD